MPDRTSMTAPPAPSFSGLEPNVAALLAYIVMIPPLMPVVMLVLEKENRFVRFHAFQSLILGLMSLLAIFGLEMLAQAAGEVARPLELILNTLILLVGGGTFMLWIVLLIKAYQGKSLKIPIIGDEAARRAQS